MPLEHRLQSLVGTWQDISWEIENALNCDDTSDIGDGEWRTAESTPEQATHWSRRNTAESEWLLGYSRIENDDLATRRLSDARSVVAPAKMTFSASEDSPTRSCHESKEATRLLSSEILTHSSPMKLEIWEAELDTLAKPKQARDWCSQNTSAFGGCDEHSRVESDYITASRSSDARKTIAAAEIVVPQQLVVLPTNSQIEPLEAELDALPELEIGAIRQPETEPMPWKAITRVRSREFSAGTTHYSVHGNVDGLSVKALPDSGADQCFISPQLAGQLGYTLDARDQRQVSLATGKKVQSPGSVMIPWKFEGEDKLHLIKSWVLPGSINNLILGSQFLNATSTLTKFTHRIKSTFGSLSKRLQLRYLGKETQGVWGFLDDEVITALPDTGSDVMLISRRYADRRGLDIDRDESCRLELELADGSTTFTHGVVKDAAWSIGNTKTEVICDFYVLDDLNVDMVLSKNYLFEMKIFQEYAEYFIDFDLEMEPDLCNIRLIGTYNDRLNALEEEYLLDCKCSGESDRKPKTEERNSIESELPERFLVWHGSERACSSRQHSR